MKFVFVTLFPEQIEAAAGHSVLKRALDTGIIAMESTVRVLAFPRSRIHSQSSSPKRPGRSPLPIRGIWKET